MRHDVARLSVYDISVRQRVATTMIIQPINPTQSPVSWCPHLSIHRLLILTLVDKRLTMIGISTNRATMSYTINFLGNTSKRTLFEINKNRKKRTHNNRNWLEKVDRKNRYAYHTNYHVCRRACRSFPRIQGYLARQTTIRRLIGRDASAIKVLTMYCDTRAAKPTVITHTTNFAIHQTGRENTNKVDTSTIKKTTNRTAKTQSLEIDCNPLQTNATDHDKNFPRNE